MVIDMNRRALSCVRGWRKQLPSIAYVFEMGKLQTNWGPFSTDRVGNSCEIMKYCNKVSAIEYQSVYSYFCKSIYQGI